MLYKNYIFDLYGTLVDIETDEYGLPLWKKLAKLYACYGAVYKPKELRKAFIRLDREERDKIRERTGTPYPENRLEIVFYRLLKEAPEGRVRLPGKEGKAAWAEFMANSFRVLSRKKMELFPGTIKKLNELREAGCKVFLLSNCQAVFTRPEIAQLGLEPCFDRMYLSSDFGMMKPDPDFLETLIQEEGLAKAETVMVGNEERNDMQIAASCGVDGLLLVPGLPKKERKKTVQERLAAGKPAAERIVDLL